MLKKFDFYDVEGNATLLVGKARNIKSTYKAMCENRDYPYYPTFCDMPSFNMDRYYGISICHRKGEFQVIGEQAVLVSLLDYIAGLG